METAVGVVRTGQDDGRPRRVYAEYDQDGTSNYIRGVTRINEIIN